MSSSLHPNRWMTSLPSATPLNALSIPGTHNSAAYFRALPSVRCQAVDIPTQLANGVRFLDIRVQPPSQSPSGEVSGSDRLVLVHGAFPIALTGAKDFRTIVLRPVERFLKENCGEAVVVSLKREGWGSGGDVQLATVLFENYLKEASGGVVWWTEARIPILGEVRGKIVLLRRFGVGSSGIGATIGDGIDAQHWAYNTSHAVSGQVCVQDFCELRVKTDMELKMNYAKKHLEAERDASLLYLNFLSASNFWYPWRFWPANVAKKLNPYVQDHLLTGIEKELGCSGVIVCDWVGWKGDWELVHCIVELNRRLLMIESEEMLNG